MEGSFSLDSTLCVCADGRVSMSPEPSTLLRLRCFTKQKSRGTREAGDMVRQLHPLSMLYRTFWRRAGNLSTLCRTGTRFQPTRHCLLENVQIVSREPDWSRAVPTGTGHVASEPGKIRNKNFPSAAMFKATGLRRPPALQTLQSGWSNHTGRETARASQTCLKGGSESVALWPDPTGKAGLKM